MMETAANSGARSGSRLVVVLLASMALGLLGVLLAQGPAQAHDHRIPATVLMKSARELQASTRVFESSWTRPSGDLCEHQTTFYRTRFPETDGVAAGTRLRVRISKAQRPDSFDIIAYHALDEAGEPSGEARPLGRSLERVVRDGKTVGWDAVFSVKDAGRDYYLISEGHWREREGCGGDQYAFWSFHVRTRA